MTGEGTGECSHISLFRRFLNTFLAFCIVLGDLGFVLLYNALRNGFDLLWHRHRGWECSCTIDDLIKIVDETF